MARVRVARQPWGTLFEKDSTGDLRVPAQGTAAVFSGTVFAAATGAGTVTGFTTDLNGDLPGWVEEGVYMLTVGGVASQVEAVSGVRKERQEANVKDFGAVGDGVTDDTAAIQAAIASLPFVVAPTTSTGPLGGVIRFPRGRYLHTGLDVSQMFGVTFEGEGSGNGGYNASQLLYTAAGARAIDARSSFGFTCRNMDIRYNNAGFTGVLIDFGHDTPSTTDAGFMKLQGCRIGSAIQEGATARNAACLVSLANAIFFTSENCFYQGAQRGIRGIDPANPGYSNAHQIRGGVFDNCSVYCIGNLGQGWLIDGVGMEGIAVLAGAEAYTFIGDDTGVANPITSLAMKGCWIGDVGFHETKALIDLPAAVTLTAPHISGNFITSFTGGNPGIRILGTVRGGSIEDNDIAASPHVDLGAAGKYGLRIQGNRMAGGAGTTATGPVTSGASVVPVVSTSGFAAAGRAFFPATNDAFDYTGKTATSFTGVTGVTTSNANGATVSNGVQHIKGAGSGHRGLWVRGNTDSTSNTQAPDKIMLGGHVLTHRTLGAPTIAAGTGLGTGATVALDPGSNDISGRVVLSTGTGPTAGSQKVCTLTFAEPFLTEAGVVDAYPHVLLTLRRSDTSPAPRVFAPNGSLTGFDIQTVDTPPVTSVVVIDYLVIQ